MEMTIMYWQSFGHIFRRKRPYLPKTIPFDLLEPFRKNIESRHGQTLERLNERGGLTPGEFYLGINNIHLKDIPNFADIRGIVAILDLLDGNAKEEEVGDG